MDHFKQELIEDLDYYNNHRIKAKLKGLPPALHIQQPFRLLEQFLLIIIVLLFGVTSLLKNLIALYFYNNSNNVTVLLPKSIYNR